MNAIDLVAVLAILQLVFFGVMAGRARAKSGLKAPAMTGDAGFERAYRVQMNTIELMVAFLPSLYIAAKYWPTSYVVGAGILYLIGRMIYWRSYTNAPETRAFGFALSMIPILALIIGILAALLLRF